MEIFREFTFEAAHRLPNVPADHKCARLHGHSFRVAVHLEGSVGDESGWVGGSVRAESGGVRDSADLRDAMAPPLDELDHHYLNEVDGLDNPTSENLARW